MKKYKNFTIFLISIVTIFGLLQLNNPAEDIINFKHIPTHFEYLKNQAEKGNVPAQIALSYEYLHNKTDHQDNEKAIYWLTKAAESGNADAQFSLGMLYRDGDHIGKNEKLAAEWYRKAAEKGNSRAQDFLSMIYFEGLGLEADYVESYYWCLIASKHDNQSSCKTFVIMRGNIKEKLTPAQIEKINSKAAKWQPIKNDPPSLNAKSIPLPASEMKNYPGFDLSRSCGDIVILGRSGVLDGSIYIINKGTGTVLDACGGMGQGSCIPPVEWKCSYP